MSRPWSELPAIPLAQLPSASPEASAKMGGLRYVSDRCPGIRRVKSGAGFRYLSPRGRSLREPSTLRRIKSLAIPPAWTEVWICPEPNGHLQATGRDARGRKQNRYHPRWREIREETKYARMLLFGSCLPRIRRRVTADLRRIALCRERVLAAVVRLLEVSLIRVGNDEYARENNSFGLTTMRNHHVDVEGEKLRFHFRGKGGKWHNIDIKDKRLARLVRRCQDLPGQELFEYLDDDRQPQDVHSEDVNAYLKEISGEDFTAKDFRTWSGTVLTAMELCECAPCETQTQAKKNYLRATEAVAARLGNTPTICRKCYVHPQILEAYLDGTLTHALSANGTNSPRRKNGLRPEEAAVLSWLAQRLAQGRRTLKAQLAASLQQRKTQRSTTLRHRR